MSRKPIGTFKQVMGPPEGGPWAWLTRELVSSPAWRARSIHCVRFIEFLIIEHMNHAGTENGGLPAPYNQLVIFGIGRRFISKAIAEAEALRLVVVERGGKSSYARDHMNLYTLTFYGIRASDAHSTYYVQPSNNWRTITEADVKNIRADLKRQNPNRVKITDRLAAEKQLTGPHVVNSTSAPLVNHDQYTGGEPAHGKPRLVTVHP